LALVTLLFSGVHFVNANDKPITISLDHSWHPFSYLDENRKPQGLLVDYWRLVGQKLGRPVQFKLVDWQQSLDLVRDGKADAHGGLFQSANRKTYLDFSDQYMDLSTGLFVAAKLNARHFSDLDNVQVGITKGSYEAEYVAKNFPEIRLKLFRNNEKLVRAALNEEVLAFVADYPVGMYYLHKYGSPEHYRVVYTLYTQHLKSAVQKGNGPLLRKINQALGKISKDEMSGITEKWILTEAVIPDWLGRVLIITGTGLVIILGFIYTTLLKRQVYLKTQSLRQEVDESIRLRNENIELVKALRLGKADAEQANIAKSKFLAAASHDLRQPLHALMLFTSVLDESIQYPEVRKVVDQIRTSIDALQNLFNALLDVSRLDAGVIQVEKTDFFLQSLLDKLVNDFEPVASEKGLRISCPACPFAANSDLIQLEQILRNYLSNAIRYTVKGEIGITCVADSSNITINVFDTGPGISKNSQQAIFSEFYQLSNPERDRSKGLGLGLAIVQRISKLLEHPINVESTPGKGSIFSVSVPQAHNVEENITDTTDITQDTQHMSNGLIIVIDDEASIREGMQSLLQRWGYEVICAADEVEVLNLLRQHGRTPDVIIADYRLREYKTGIETILAIHTEYGKYIPALIITGDTSADEIREVDNSGFQVLYKPVAPTKLRAFLRYVQSNK